MGARLPREIEARFLRVDPKAERSARVRQRAPQCHVRELLAESHCGVGDAVVDAMPRKLTSGPLPPVSQMSVLRLRSDRLVEPHRARRELGLNRLLA